MAEKNSIEALTRGIQFQIGSRMLSSRGTAIEDVILLKIKGLCKARGGSSRQGWGEKPRDSWSKP